MKKRILSLVVALCMMASLITALPITVSAATSGTCGENITWVLDKNGVLTISGTGAIYSSTYFDGPWYSNRDSIKSVIIEDGITNICYKAFYACDNLTNVEIPESVTIIEDWAFGSCSALTSVKIPDSVTSIGYAAFYSCDGLTSIEIPDSVESIGEVAFRGCYKMSSAKIGNGVKTIGDGAFLDCTELADVSLGSGLTSIGDRAFYCCNKLTYLTIPESVTYIHYKAFMYCHNLTLRVYENSYAHTFVEANHFPYELINVAEGTCGNNLKWTLSGNGVLTISGTGDMENYSAGNGYAPWYSYTSDIKEVVIENGVTSIGVSAFECCKSLTSIEIPDGVTSIGDWTFSYCIGLTSVKIPDSVTMIGEYAFFDCDKLTLKVYENSYAHTYAVDNGIAYKLIKKLNELTISKDIKKVKYGEYRDLKEIEKITIPGNVNTIMGTAFFNCKDLKELVIENGVKTIKEAAFASCYKLTNVTIPESVETIDKTAFKYCMKLTKITYGGTRAQWNEKGFDGLDYLDGVYVLCSDEEDTLLENFDYTLKNKKAVVTKIPNDAAGEIVIPKTIDGYIVNEVAAKAFKDNSTITSVVLPDAITIIGGYAFENCTALKTVVLPAKLAYVSTAMFNNCKNLEEVVLPEAISKICWAAFYNCGALKTIEIPEKTKAVADSAFAKCISLTDVAFSDSLKEIGYSAFNNCKNITELLFGKNLTKIGDWAFTGCTKVTEISFGENITSIGNSAFRDCINVPVLTLPESLKEVEVDAFMGCKKLTEINLPASLTELSKGMFRNCYRIKNVNYNGTQEQWDIIIIRDGNDYVRKAVITYAPSVSGADEYPLAIFMKAMKASDGENDIYKVTFMQGGEVKTIATDADMANADDFVKSSVISNGALFAYATTPAGDMKDYTLISNVTAGADMFNTSKYYANYINRATNRGPAYEFGFVQAKSDSTITLADLVVTSGTATFGSNVMKRAIDYDATYTIIDLNKSATSASRITPGAFAEIQKTSFATDGKLADIDRDVAVFLKYVDDEVVDVVIIKGAVANIFGVASH